ncbi:hypothetical protein OG895_42970 [Streptomyces sp. NBC_00201]|uniref:hypothetical protein n=1 Tax=unclassified Streptomyces TaxID=2593676 RepID=UPI00224F9FC6|nr:MULTISPECIES: hypothetical protein [unclassified Streptomyces]MCX5054536.1 hypothetical protein [Streptomyces sp. NBC_00474]MCX5063663.1 hypothetical protein [Streptomyces sp. NBC_00452]MCX5251818.1 hypothetical protein [Streptomyces sp. NBC_00201]MCX5294279.1 hypothetical protein [Streptomyces sp. NBC_00183]
MPDKVTCDDKRINVITDVAAVVSSADGQALPGIHARLKRLRLLPGQHLVDGGYTSVDGMDTAARLHRVTLGGPLPSSTSPQHRAGDGFGRENFVIGFDQREVTCPNGQVSGNWRDLPVAEPTSVVVRFDARQCGRCPEQAACTPGPFRSPDPRRGSSTALPQGRPLTWGFWQQSPSGIPTQGSP